MEGRRESGLNSNDVSKSDHNKMYQSEIDFKVPGNTIENDLP